MSKPRSKPPGHLNIVGERVRALRIEKRMSQKELLRRIQTEGMDIGESSISRLEFQDRIVQDYELICIARALDVGVRYLLGLTNDRAPD